jgi:hypothetical protein
VVELERRQVIQTTLGALFVAEILLQSLSVFSTNPRVVPRNTCNICGRVEPGNADVNVRIGILCTARGVRRERDF